MTIGRKDLRNAVSECLTPFLCESASSDKKERMLENLFAYLSQEPTNDIYDGNGKGAYINTTYPAFNYFNPKGIVHNVWAVHYTNLEGFEGIQEKGFLSGLKDYDRLAYSDGYGANRSYGWSFTLPIDSHYIGDDLGYGDCGFIILTDGVRAYHKGDGDDEIIFRGCHVKKMYPFVYEDDYDCWVLVGFGNEYGQSLPKGAYWCDDIGKAVFSGIRPMIRYVTGLGHNVL